MNSARVLMTAWIAAFSGCVILASANPAFAKLPDTRSCLVRLDEAVRPGKTIDVLMTGDSLFQGIYAGFTPDHSALRVQLGPEKQSLTEVPFDRIRAVKYKSTGHIQMKYAVYGLLVGAAAGALYGAMNREASSSGFSLRVNVGSGAFFGGLGGLILGPLVSAGVRREHVVACVEHETALPAKYLVTFEGGKSVGAREVRMQAGMVFVEMTNAQSVYVNPARVLSIVDKYGIDRRREVLDEKHSLR